MIVEIWKAKHIMNYLRNQLEIIKMEKRKKEVELKCLTSEYESLEKMIFTIESHVESEAES